VDQPDLKARFRLSIKTTSDWKLVSNTALQELADLPLTHSADWSKALITYHFDETKPISTYVFGFAAGPWQQMSTTIGNEDITRWYEPNFNLNVYVRQSQSKRY